MGKRKDFHVNSDLPTQLHVFLSPTAQPSASGPYGRGWARQEYRGARGGA